MFFNLLQRGQHDFSSLPICCQSLGGELGDVIYDISKIIFETKFHFFQYHYDLGLTWKAVAIGVGVDDGNATEDAVDVVMGGKMDDGEMVHVKRKTIKLVTELMCDILRDTMLCF